MAEDMKANSCSGEEKTDVFQDSNSQPDRCFPGFKLTTRNGDHYEGNWILNQRQGHGILHCADGTIYEERWLILEKRERGFKKI
ncbi:unnamed protein product [Ranitomeya imitator]|uniref:MORN repeat-containing protein 5 n=1 Tax=Ranitomeya imitator TaxID=111125 RepID=A0ABN9KRJ7_9NEOB|nr:unnamed protein product [Ranitomeya imitator]